jgi:hypothetical protein
MLWDVAPSALVRTDISEKIVPSIISVKGISELGTI